MGILVENEENKPDRREKSRLRETRAASFQGG